MPTLTLLHLSDIHWSAEKAADQAIIVQALVEDLKRLGTDNDIKPDLVVVSGDLVQAGEDAGQFLECHKHCLQPILAATGLDESALFIAPGNHDVSRAAVRATQYVQRGLEATLSSVDSVNAFIDQYNAGDKSVLPAFESMNNFDYFHSLLNLRPPITDNCLLRTYAFPLGDQRLGVACFNTAWRASGEDGQVDRHRLLIGERNVDNAIRDLAGASIRLALFHHPLDWLTDFDAYAVSGRLFSAFDILLFGHVHVLAPMVSVTPVGSSVICQSCCTYEDRQYINGYQLITLDVAESAINIFGRTYFDSPRRAFDKAVNILDDGRVAFSWQPTASAQIATHIEAFLRDARPVIRKNASDQINLAEIEAGLQPDVRDAFVSPPLTTRRAPASSDQSGPEMPPSVTPEEILRGNGNFILVGPRESGKSSLAHYMAVMCAEGTIDKPRIPIIINYDAFPAKNIYGLRKAAGNYFGISRRGLDINKLIASGELLLLFDNFSGLNSVAKKQFEAFVKSIDKCRVICFADAYPTSLSVQLRVADELQDFNVIHIQALPRRAIRQLSQRWCDHAGLDGDEAFNAVMGHLQSSNLPRSGYIVTLLLWAVLHEKSTERLNEAVLLANIVDYLLGKSDFTQAYRGSYDAASKEITLREFSQFLRGKGGSATSFDALMFLGNFFSEKGLRHNPEEALHALVRCGILIQEDGYISFKYRCFQEYFYALYLMNNSDALSECLSGFNFIQFSRELDILTGLRRDSTNVVIAIQERLASASPTEIVNAALGNFKEIALSESKIGLPRRRIKELRTKKLSSGEIDDLLDETDRRIAESNRASPKKKIDKSPDKTESTASTGGGTDSASRAIMDMDTFSLANDLLGKVTRNSEFANRDLKLGASKRYIGNIARFYIEVVRIIEDIFQKIEEKRIGRGEEPLSDGMRALRYIVNKILIVGILSTASDSIGTVSLVPIFEEMLDDNSLTEIEKIALGLLLLDLNVPEWEKYWVDIIEVHRGRRFVQEALLEKLWSVIHSRPMKDAERRAVIRVVGKIELALGLSETQKSKVGLAVNKASDKVEREDK